MFSLISGVPVGSAGTPVWRPSYEHPITLIQRPAPLLSLCPLLSQVWFYWTSGSLLSCSVWSYIMDFLPDFAGLVQTLQPPPALRWGERSQVLVNEKEGVITGHTPHCTSSWPASQVLTCANNKREISWVHVSTSPNSSNLLNPKA